jgi:Flp pilus assembly secretin CpaC
MMSTKKTAALLTALAIFAVPAAGAAQEKPEAPRKRPTPLKVQVVFSKYQGEKKVTSLPYTLLVNADDRPTALRMGIQVPLPGSAAVKEGLVLPPTPVVYKDVGTSLDCTAQGLDDGSFKLSFGLEQSSISSGDMDRRAPGAAVADTALANAPVLRTFKVQTNMVLRDGQTAQYFAATDPLSGEVLRIEVTINVLK